MGGSTNMVLHMITMAKRAGVDVSFDTWDRLSRETPTRVKLAPSGPWGVTDLGDARGVPGVMKGLGKGLKRDAIGVSGQTAGEVADAAEILNPDCIHTDAAPVEPEGSIFTLRGTLAPGGAVVKASGVAKGMWAVTLAARCSRTRKAPSRRSGPAPSIRGHARAEVRGL